MDKVKRQELLTEWASNFSMACYRGVLGTKATLERIETISGPRTAALDVFAGFDSSALLRAVNKNEAANARQLVPWNFEGRPMAYMQGKAIRVEVPWSQSEMIKDFSIHEAYKRVIPHDTGRWFAGLNILGGLVTLGFTSFTPHYLVAGTTGSGKSVTIRSAAWQLASFPTNRLVFIDGKMGEGLSLCSGLPNQLGPMVTNADLNECLDVMHWLVNVMNQRYQDIISLREMGWSPGEIILGKGDEPGLGRIIIFIDEVQELIKSNPMFQELLRKLATQSRAANMHLVLSTQHPTAEVFNDSSIKAVLSGRIALRVSHPEASRSALGQSWPRADWLLGQGDAYVMTASAEPQRVQIGYIPDSMFLDIRALRHRPELDAWPNVSGETESSMTGGFDIEALTVAVVSRLHKEGRVRLLQRLAEAGLPSNYGKSRTRALIQAADSALGTFSRLGYCLLPDRNDTV